MAGNDEHGQPAGIQAERTAEESARPAWAKPVIRRFSLHKTLAGSGGSTDLVGNGSRSNL
jgi:hypothetical protein